MKTFWYFGISSWDFSNPPPLRKKLFATSLYDSYKLVENSLVLFIICWRHIRALSEHLELFRTGTGFSWEKVYTPPLFKKKEIFSWTYEEKWTCTYIYRVPEKYNASLVCTYFLPLPAKKNQKKTDIIVERIIEMKMFWVSEFKYPIKFSILRWSWFQNQNFTLQISRNDLAWRIGVSNSKYVFWVLILDISLDFVWTLVRHKNWYFTR